MSGSAIRPGRTTRNFSAAGFQIKTYSYFNNSSLSLDYGAFIESLNSIPAGDLVVLHACCHNPMARTLALSNGTR